MEQAPTHRSELTDLARRSMRVVGEYSERFRLQSPATAQLLHCFEQAQQNLVSIVNLVTRVDSEISKLGGVNAQHISLVAQGVVTTVKAFISAAWACLAQLNSEVIADSTWTRKPKRHTVLGIHLCYEGFGMTSLSLLSLSLSLYLSL
eukprot:TRINITY_DN3363_c0_g1_i1.p1 TRINITY_DN3363_c0_g1~~TRINITY_DN3363_c0_g1_i1.p1  ORF type:complete len:148 (-),score=11.35 TRINITY_DN3363_c0_g1_i1:260-703(-)